MIPNQADQWGFAFAPSTVTNGGNSYCVSATASTSDTPIVYSKQYLMQNRGTADVFFAFGTSAVTVVIPTAGSPANGICLPHGTQTFTLPPGTSHVGFISSTGTQTVYLTPGEGE